MFPPRNRHNIRLIRARSLFFTGNKRKGLYAVLTIAIVCCVIFALDTMHEQYDMESQENLNDEKRRMSAAAGDPSASMIPLPANFHLKVGEEWTGIMVVPSAVSTNQDDPLSYTLYERGIPPWNSLESDETTPLEGKPIGMMTPKDAYFHYVVDNKRYFDKEVEENRFSGDFLVQFLILNDQTDPWIFQWVTKELIEDTPRYMKALQTGQLRSVGYLVQWRGSRLMRENTEPIVKRKIRILGPGRTKPKPSAAT